jgi:hypothetical protein
MEMRIAAWQGVAASAAQKKKSAIFFMTRPNHVAAAG